MTSEATATTATAAATAGPAVDRVLGVLNRALRLLDHYLVSDIECNAVAVHLAPGERRWYDVRPMLDRREHSTEWVDMAELAISWGLERGALRRHEQHPHLVQCQPLPLP